ncbi:hypothetical protein D3C77_592070 [compost metagenome]
MRLLRCEAILPMAKMYRLSTAKSMATHSSDSTTMLLPNDSVIWMNCGKKAMKKMMSFGLEMPTMKPCSSPPRPGLSSSPGASAAGASRASRSVPTAM